MGFLDIMKKAMGFSHADDDELEEVGIDATVTPLRQRIISRDMSEYAVQDNFDDISDKGDNSDPSGEASVSLAVDEPSPDTSVIFEKVVSLFNEALPIFIRDSVDPEKQRRLLYDSLDSSVKDYFERLEKNVERRLRVRYDAENRKLYKQIDDLRQKAVKEEEGSSNAKNLQLSAERQKRALSERVHELEKQLSSIEAENEQYILENKTMANKLRLAAMSDGEIDTSCQDILNRESEIKVREENLSVREENLNEREAKLAEQISEADSRLQEAERKIAEAEERAAAVDDSQKIASLEQEIALLHESIEQAKAKDELSRAMVNDLNTIAVEARKAASEKDEKVASLQSELDNANEQLAALNSRLLKAQEDLQVVKEVREQVSKLEESQRVSDARLRRQTDEILEKDEIIRAKDSEILTKNTTLRLKDEAINRLEDQADSLRKTIEAAQYEKTQTESALRGEIERLKAVKGGVSVVESTEPEPKNEVEIPIVSSDNVDLDLTLDLPELVTPEAASISIPKPRRGRPPKQQTDADQDAPQIEPKEKKKGISRDDDHDISLLDSTDWLISTPATETQPKPKRQRKQKNESSDDAFGYKEPIRQEPPDNPAQMLLW